MVLRSPSKLTANAAMQATLQVDNHAFQDMPTARRCSASIPTNTATTGKRTAFQT